MLQLWERALLERQREREELILKTMRDAGEAGQKLMLDERAQKRILRQYYEDLAKAKRRAYFQKWNAEIVEAKKAAEKQSAALMVESRESKQWKAERTCEKCGRRRWSKDPYCTTCRISKTTAPNSGVRL